MSQLYLVKLEVDLGDAIEKTTVAVTADNADKASMIACMHCQVSPTMATVDVRRIKGNAYGITQDTKRKPAPDAAVVVPANAAPKLAPATLPSGVVAPPPRLSKRRIEVQATIFSRTDSSAYVGLGRAIEIYGRTNRWLDEYVHVEQIRCADAEETKPSNQRVLENAQYTVTKVFR